MGPPLVPIVPVTIVMLPHTPFLVKIGSLCHSPYPKNYLPFLCEVNRAATALESCSKFQVGSTHHQTHDLLYLLLANDRRIDPIDHVSFEAYTAWISAKNTLYTLFGARAKSGIDACRVCRLPSNGVR